MNGKIEKEKSQPKLMYFLYI